MVTWQSTSEEESILTTNGERKLPGEQDDELTSGNDKSLDTSKPFQFDPIAVENLRQAIIQYDMMLLKNPKLKQEVEDFLKAHKAKKH